MNDVEYHVFASNDPDGWPEEIVGSTSNWEEALEWREQAQMDGWALAWIEAVAAGTEAA